MKKYIITILTLIASYSGYSIENNYKCHLKNLKQVSKNEMTFDIWIEWENNIDSQFHGIQSGIDFDFDAIANGGKLTASIVSSTVKFTENNTLGIKIDEVSKQLRIAAFVIPKTGDLAVNVKEIRIGTFKIKNSNAFTPDSKPHFTWYSGNTNHTKTSNLVLAYDNNSRKIINTTELSNHKIENSDFILNPKGKGSFVAFENKQIIHFTIYELAEGDTTMELFDLNGRHIQSDFLVVKTDEIMLDMNLKNVSSGIYIVKVSNNNKSYSKKIQVH